MNMREYYEAELSTLQQDTRAFGQAYPHIAPFLTEQSRDPDVERLLEGFAYLTAKIRAQASSLYPELTSSLLSILYPGAMRSFPSCMVIALAEQVISACESWPTLPAGELLTLTNQGRDFYFQSCWPLEVKPVKLQDISVTYHVNKVVTRWIFDLQSPTLHAELDLGALSFYFGKLGQNAYDLLQQLHGHCQAIRIGDDEKGMRSSTANWSWRGFMAEESLRPNMAPSVLELLTEFYLFPEKFLFADLCGIKVPLAPRQTRFIIEMDFDTKTKFDWQMLATYVDEIRLNCVPVINLFSLGAIPFLKKWPKQSYTVQPDVTYEGECAIYDIEQVSGWNRRLQQRTEYSLAFSPAVLARQDRQLRRYLKKWSRHPSKSYSRLEIDFMDEAPSDDETVSMTCLAYQPDCFRLLPAVKQPGNFGGFPVQIVSRLTQPIAIDLAGEQQALLLSYLIADFDQIDDVHKIQSLLWACQIIPASQRKAFDSVKTQIDGLHAIEQRQTKRVWRGSLLYGLETQLTWDESVWGCHGEIYLFSKILHQVLESRTLPNSFHDVTLLGLETGARYSWQKSFQATM